MTRLRLRSCSRLVTLVGTLALATACGAPPPGDRPAPQSARSTRYEDLVALFNEWRAFQRPKLVNGVPDYTRGGDGGAAQGAGRLSGAPRRHRSQRLADPAAGGLPHRPRRDERSRLRSSRAAARGRTTRRSTSRSSRARAISRRAKGRSPYGAVELWSYSFPLSATGRRDRRRRRACRAGAARPGAERIWSATARISGCTARATCDSRAPTCRRSRPGSTRAEQARWRRTSSARRVATDEFAAWLETGAASKTGPSGVGVENYDWYLQNVMLLPYTWRDLVTLMERELARAHSSLALEETQATPRFRRRRRSRPPRSIPAASTPP